MGGVKKVEKKEVEEPKAPEKVQLKKPKHIEKPKEEPQEGIKLKPIPAKEKSEEEKPEGVKLKPIPQKEKEDTTQASKQIKVSNVVNKTHEKASKENEQDVVETKHAEKAPTLTHSISREDDKIKIKKTSINDRASIDAEAMKQEIIMTKVQDPEEENKKVSVTTEAVVEEQVQEQQKMEATAIPEEIKAGEKNMKEKKEPISEANIELKAKEELKESVSEPAEVGTNEEQILKEKKKQVTDAL